ncbi:hypothetical protein AMK26_34515 [Streptomyces sp. CB03234]|uniref:hypothetical protein n=1 Tax=Streptomyces sp. (strain CB03234) TaxID=1703937 RepID=UPI00093B219C|nr:hypothetical protein [Streptomyces sp. CB03234]OKJ92677.1 hypothetical protein AMK26_34515 [Streptomyces sp. CB03234]
MPRTDFAIDCADCRGLFNGMPQPHYDHVHTAEKLPRARCTDAHIVKHGYAVGFAGNRGLPQTWIFYADLEPAVVFGRAARMSVFDVNHYGVTEAARETRWTERLHRDVVTLHLKQDSDLRDHDDEMPILKRWVRGCRPDSAHYERP